MMEIPTTWEMYYNVAAWEMYYDFDITVVDFNEFVLSFQYEVDKMKVFEAWPWSVRVEIEVFLVLLMLIFVCRA